MIIRCMDFETTGFPPRAGVCEAGWTDLTITHDGEIEIGETVSFLCNPGLPIGEEAMKVHGITEQMVADQPPSATIFRRMMEGADVFCAHNAEFERNFFTGGDRQWICTYKVALVLYPDLPNHKNGTIPEHLGIELDSGRCEPLHRAGPDTYVTAKLLERFVVDHNKQYGNGYMGAVWDFVHFTKKPKQVSRMPAGKGKYPGVLISELPSDYLDWGCRNYPIKEYRDAMAREIEARDRT